ncbi:MAG: MazG nucleotide pyrophosphohydrolase domain-containing protein [Aeromicrobium sp.]
MQVLVLSPRVAPGILTLAAWDALRVASTVRASVDDPHVRAIIDSGIAVDSGTGAPTYEPGSVWIAPTGDATWARAVADDLMGPDGDERQVEVVFGSYDLPGSGLLDVVDVMDRLRRECPWTAEQTHESLARYVLEEAQEVHEALQEGDTDHVREELGDLLMQVVFHARIAAESQGWDVDDVAAGIAAKLIRRNPHVFAPETLDHVPATADEIDAQWQRIKLAERASDPHSHPH